jgi:hypothetical protein
MEEITVFYLFLEPTPVEQLTHSWEARAYVPHWLIPGPSHVAWVSKAYNGLTEDAVGFRVRFTDLKGTPCPEYKPNQFLFSQLLRVIACVNMATPNVFDPSGLDPDPISLPVFDLRTIDGGDALYRK